MDKRFTPLTHHEQMQKRIAMVEQHNANPNWPISHVVYFIRSELQLTQPELAKLCKVAKQTISNIELGNANPTITTIDKILKPFGFKMRVGRVS